jgi:hypothetical protein
MSSTIPPARLGIFRDDQGGHRAVTLRIRINTNPEAPMQ